MKPAMLLHRLLWGAHKARKESKLKLLKASIINTCLDLLEINQTNSRNAVGIIKVFKRMPCRQHQAHPVSWASRQLPAP